MSDIVIFLYSVSSNTIIWNICRSDLLSVAFDVSVIVLCVLVYFGIFDSELMLFELCLWEFFESRIEVEFL